MFDGRLVVEEKENNNQHESGDYIEMGIDGNANGHHGGGRKGRRYDMDACCWKNSLRVESIMTQGSTIKGRGLRRVPLPRKYLKRILRVRVLAILQMCFSERKRASAVARHPSILSIRCRYKNVEASLLSLVRSLEEESVHLNVLEPE